MIPTLFFFICLMYSGGEDCTYDLEITNDREQFKDNENGFTDFNNKQIVIFNYKVLETLKHEKLHVKCNLEYPLDSTMRWYCNFKIDLVYNSQAIRPEYTPPNPTINKSPKLLDQERMYGNNYLPTTQIWARQ